MIVDTPEIFEKVMDSLRGQTDCVLDIETSGLDLWGKAELCGVGLEFGGSAYYLPFRHQGFNAATQPLFAEFLSDQLDVKNLPLELMEDLWDTLATVQTVIGHNIKFDMTGLVKDGYVPPIDQEFEDTLCGARLYFAGDEDRLSLDNCSRVLLKRDDTEWKRKFKDYLAGRGILNAYHQAEIPIIAEYCEMDCSSTRLIRDKLIEHANKTGQSFIYNQEKKVIRTFFDMEVGGLRIDREYIKNAIERCTEACSALMAEMVKYAGREFNPGAAADVSKVMRSLGISTTVKTATGLDSWSEASLIAVSGYTVVAQMILDWRAINKMVTTFFAPYLERETDWIHPNFKSWVPKTGRVSVDNPNLQQVSRPVDWEKDHPELWKLCPGFDLQVRKMFITPEGFKFTCWDYSQMEMLVYAAYLEDPKLTAKLNAGGIDFHSLVANMIWGVDQNSPDFKAYRSKAKAISLGLVYMMGKETLANSLGCDVQSALKFREEYFKVFPKAADFIWAVRKKIRDGVRSSAENLGTVSNRFGRQYQLPEEHDYKAINYLVQGSSADLVKRAMVRLRDEYLKRGFKSRLAFQMHDEFGFYIHEDEWNEAAPIIPKIMEDNPEFSVFLPVDGSLCLPDWATKKKLCKDCFRLQEECGGKCKNN